MIIDGLGRKEVVVFDLDGTVYFGEQPVDGVPEMIARLRDNGVSVFFVTNNSSMLREACVEQLSSMGVPASEDDVVLSTDSVLSYLTERGVTDTYVVGTEAMRTLFYRHGIHPVAEDPSHVVVGFDAELTYEKVRRATVHIQDGAEFIAAHPDRSCPTPDGSVPDCGAITALVETALDREPDRTLGKPDQMMLEPVYERTGAAPEDVLVVGDRLKTDIGLAEAAGVDSALVLTGDASREDIQVVQTTTAGGTAAVSTPGGTPEPDLVFDQASAIV